MNATHTIIIDDVHYSVERAADKLVGDPHFRCEVSRCLLQSDQYSGFLEIVDIGKGLGYSEITTFAAVRWLYGAVLERTPSGHIVRLSPGEKPNWALR